MSGDDGYIESWARRIIANAPRDETPEQVLALMRSCQYLNRGRWAAYVVRLGAAQGRTCEGIACKQGIEVDG